MHCPLHCHVALPMQARQMRSAFTERDKAHEQLKVLQRTEKHERGKFVEQMRVLKRESDAHDAQSHVTLQVRETSALSGVLCTAWPPLYRALHDCHCIVHCMPATVSCTAWPPLYRALHDCHCIVQCMAATVSCTA